MEHFSGCLVCGANLIYSQENRRLCCFYCKKEVETDVLCKNDHYVCDSCHSCPANDLIESTCIHATSIDPLYLANLLFHHPSVKLHGPEHHFLVPAVLLAAFYNHRNEQKIKAKKIKLARQRAESIKGGSCGTLGTCGAAIGSGIFVSIITEATPLSRGAWGLSNLMTAQSLQRIAEHDGPLCCKRVSYLAIQIATEFLNSHFDTFLLAFTNSHCEFSLHNKECLEQDCPFYCTLSD